MKKPILFVILVSFAAISVFGESKLDFDSSVDFSVTFKELYEGINSGKSFDTGKFLIIDGSVTARIVVNDEEDNFIAELELVNGAWVGLEAVEIYKCYIILTGSEFANRIPARRARNKLPDEIELNARVLVVGKMVSTRRGDGGTIIPVLEAIYIRPL